MQIRRLDPFEPTDETLFGDWVGVYAEAQRAIWGDQGSAWSVGERRAHFAQATNRRFAWAAIDDGQVAGAAELNETLLDNLGSAAIDLAVLPGSRRRGLGHALLEVAESQGRADGRGVFFAETEWPIGGSDEAGGFAQHHGYAPAQTEIRRSLALPADRAVMRRLRDESGRRPAAYTLHSAWDAFPEMWLEDRALLARRMSTDIPLGELQWEEERWDADRVRESFDHERQQGRRVLEVLARHEASGRLVGYSRISLPAQTPELVYQQDTLVISEHRGHRIGLRLKAAAALELMEHAFQVRTWRTWNAVENAPMIAVNEDLGYTVEGYLREWQKLDD